MALGALSAARAGEAEGRAGLTDQTVIGSLVSTVVGLGTGNEASGVEEVEGCIPRIGSYRGCSWRRC